MKKLWWKTLLRLLVEKRFCIICVEMGNSVRKTLTQEEAKMQNGGKHLYGVMREGQQRDFGSIGVGDGQGRVYTIHYQGLAAIVSDTPMMAYDSVPRETLVRYLANHQFVIEQVMKSHAVIPIKFGTAVKDEEEVKQILAKGYQQFNAALEEMGDKIELEVVATWSDFDAILREIGEEQRVRDLRREAAARPPSEMEAAKIELGKMVKSALEERNANAASEIVDSLKGSAVEYCPHEVLDDSMIMNVAFLIPRDKEGEFDREVNQVNERYQDRVDFRCVGPLPPYSFSTVEVKRISFEEVNAARILLGLGEEATSDEIKESHRRLAHQFHPDQHPGDPEAQKHFEKITKAYRLLMDYCQQERCSFGEEEVQNFMLIRVLEM
ncbi:MAG: GvpL/GvpF family gas vesicle protein [Dehalococcoidia bacterium]